MTESSNQSYGFQKDPRRLTEYTISGSESGSKDNVSDLDATTYYEHSADNCFLKFDFGPSNKAHVTSIIYTGVLPKNKLDYEGAIFEGS